MIEEQSEYYLMIKATYYLIKYKSKAKNNVLKLIILCI